MITIWPKSLFGHFLRVTRRVTLLSVPIHSLIHWTYFFYFISFSRFCFVVNYSSRGSRVRQLRRDVDASVAAGRNRSLFVQRLWSLLQDERAKPSAHQAQAQTGKCKSRNFLFNSSFLHFLCYSLFFVFISIGFDFISGDTVVVCKCRFYVQRKKRKKILFNPPWCWWR